MTHTPTKTAGRFVTGTDNGGTYEFVAPFQRYENSENVYDANDQFVAKCATQALALFMVNTLNKEYTRTAGQFND